MTTCVRLPLLESRVARTPTASGANSRFRPLWSGPWPAALAAADWQVPGGSCLQACAATLPGAPGDGREEIAGSSPDQPNHDRETLLAARGVHLRLSGAYHAAVVATRMRIVDVQIAHPFIRQETPNGGLKVASTDDLRANHHGRCVISAK